MIVANNAKCNCSNTMHVGDTIAFNGVSQNIADVMNASTNASRLVGMVNTKTVR